MLKLVALGIAVVVALCAPAIAADAPPAAPTAAQVFALVAPAVAAARAVPGSAAPAWQRHAVAAVDTGDKPRIAVVIDDVGVHVPNAWRVLALPAPLTVSLMTYAINLPQLAAAARAQGHELLLHVPMEPEGGEVPPGPNVLLTGGAPEDLRRRMEWAFGRVDGVVGINNHMGSHFTADRAAMDVLMVELARRGMLFLDSVTTGHTVGRQASRAASVPYLARDVFLDNEDNVAVVRAHVAELEAVARRDGSAIAIAHPKAATIEVLMEWLPALSERGFAIVPLSALVASPAGVAAQR